MAFDTEGCEIESNSAAFPMLPVSATVMKMCRSCNLSRRPIRSFHLMKSHLQWGDGVINRWLWGALQQRIRRSVRCYGERSYGITIQIIQIASAGPHRCRAIGDIITWNLAP